MRTAGVGILLLVLHGEDPAEVRCPAPAALSAESHSSPPGSRAPCLVAAEGCDRIWQQEM